MTTGIRQRPSEHRRGPWTVGYTLVGLFLIGLCLESLMPLPEHVERLSAGRSFLTPMATAQSLDTSMIEPETLVIEDFSGNPTGAFPTGWEVWMRSVKQVDKIYFIQQEKGNAYLQARGDEGAIAIGKAIRSWNPKRYPVLTWRWRARVLPRGGDERYKETNDCANAVYVTLSKNVFNVPRILKYVWSTTLPVGTIHKRSGIIPVYVIVLESGTQHLGTWVSERVDVYADYRRLFGEEPPAHAIGIGVMTDQNETHAGSAGDYDDFILEHRQVRLQARTD